MNASGKYAAHEKQTPEKQNEKRNNISNFYNVEIMLNRIKFPHDEMIFLE